MSAISLETSICELTETVRTLGSRIISLEKVVLDQNKLIKKLIGVSDDSAQTTQIRVNVGRSTDNTGQLTQRPMRGARVRAETALAINARKTKGARNISPVVRTGRPEELEPNASSNLSEPPTPTQPLPADSPQLESVDTAALPMIHARDNNNDLDWVEIKRKKSRRAPDNVTRGTALAGSTVCALAAAERKSYLHLYYVQTGTTAEQVIAHLRKICVDDKCSAEVLRSRGDYASFKLTVPTKNVENYMKPEHWAEDVHIKPWRSGFRKSQQ